MLSSYFEILKTVLDSKCISIPYLSDKEWRVFFDFCQKQNIIGIVLDGLKVFYSSNETLGIPRDIILKWIVQYEQVRQQNVIVNKCVVEFCKKIESEGYVCCILKGQGNNLLYPNPYSRMPGDIDVWLSQKRENDKCYENNGKVITNIIKYVKKYNGNCNAQYHHIDYGLFQNVEVEIHYRPSFMNNLIYNYRLQKWFRAIQNGQFLNKVQMPGTDELVAIPTSSFNVIFQLTHIYRHLIQKGIGLRHVIDYYYVLKAYVKEDNEKQEIKKLLKEMGLERIAGAMMWVLQTQLGLEKQFLIAHADERRGQLLLHEIVNGGNFGYNNKDDKEGKSRFGRNVQRIKRDFYLMCYFPSECLWEPVFRVYHYFWRLKWNRK